MDSGRKLINFDISGREKRIDLSELYLKKNVNKIPRQCNSFLDKERCTTPMANYNKKIKNKLIPALFKQSEKNINIYHKKITTNCLTCVDRKKEAKYLEMEEDVDKEEKQYIQNNTVETNNSNNNYIYNKPNLIIKKQKSKKNN